MLQASLTITVILVDGNPKQMSTTSKLAIKQPVLPGAVSPTTSPPLPPFVWLFLGCWLNYLYGCLVARRATERLITNTLPHVIVDVITSGC